MVQILARFDWRVVGMLFHNHDPGKGAGNSPCHFALAAVYGELDKQGHKSVHKSFDETNGSVNFTQLLLHIGERSRSKFRAFYIEWQVQLVSCFHENDHWQLII